MPMFTMSVKRAPVAPPMAPSRTPAAKAAVASSTSRTSAMTSWPSTSTGRSERLRSAVCSTARPSVTLIFSPANMASRASSTSAARASASSFSRVSGRMRFFE